MSLRLKFVSTIGISNRQSDETISLLFKILQEFKGKLRMTWIVMSFCLYSAHCSLFFSLFSRFLYLFPPPFLQRIFVLRENCKTLVWLNIFVFLVFFYCLLLFMCSRNILAVEPGKRHLLYFSSSSVWNCYLCPYPL